MKLRWAAACGIEGYIRRSSSCYTVRYDFKLPLSVWPVGTEVLLSSCSLAVTAFLVRGTRRITKIMLYTNGGKHYAWKWFVIRRLSHRPHLSIERYHRRRKDLYHIPCCMMIFGIYEQCWTARDHSDGCTVGQIINMWTLEHIPWVLWEPDQRSTILSCELLVRYCTIDLSIGEFHATFSVNPEQANGRRLPHNRVITRTAY